MKLYEFLEVCSPNDYVGIWDVDVRCDKKNKSRKRFEECPTEQNYFKIGNIPYGRISQYLKMDILYVNHTQKGYLVRLYSKDKLQKSLFINELIDELKRR